MKRVDKIWKTPMQKWASKRANPDSHKLIPPRNTVKMRRRWSWTLVSASFQPFLNFCPSSCTLPPTQLLHNHQNKNPRFHPRPGLSSHRLLADQKHRRSQTGQHDVVDEGQPRHRRGGMDVYVQLGLHHPPHQLGLLLGLRHGWKHLLGCHPPPLHPLQHPLLDRPLCGLPHPQRYKLPLLHEMSGKTQAKIQINSGPSWLGQRSLPRPL